MEAGFSNPGEKWWVSGGNDREDSKKEVNLRDFQDTGLARLGYGSKIENYRGGESLFLDKKMYVNK